MADGIVDFARKAMALLKKKEELPAQRDPRTAEVQKTPLLEVTKSRPEYQRTKAGYVDMAADAPRSAPNKASPGQLERGNINNYGRPSINNADGSKSTVNSMSFRDGDREVLIPKAYDGGQHPDDEAIAHYRATGQHLGRFDTPEHATEYASRLHDDYANGRFEDNGSHVLEERRGKDIGEMSGTMTEHNPTRQRSASSSLSPSGGYPRAERPENVEARTAEHLRKAQAQGHPFTQEARFRNDAVTQGMQDAANKYIPDLRGRGMQLAADRVAELGKKVQDGATQFSVDAINHPVGSRMIRGSQGAEQRLGEVIGPTVEKVMDRYPVDTNLDKALYVDLDNQGTTMPEVTVEGGGKNDANGITKAYNDYTGGQYQTPDEFNRNRSDVARHDVTDERVGFDKSPSAGSSPKKKK